MIDIGENYLVPPHGDFIWKKMTGFFATKIVAHFTPREKLLQFGAWGSTQFGSTLANFLAILFQPEKVEFAVASLRYFQLTVSIPTSHLVTPRFTSRAAICMKYARDFDDLGIGCWSHGQESKSGETYSLLLMPCLVVVTLGPSVWYVDSEAMATKPPTPQLTEGASVRTSHLKKLRPLCQYVMNDLCHPEFLHEFGIFAIIGTAANY